MSIDFNRYLVKMEYYGKFTDTETLCACQSVKDANLIKDLLSEHYEGRPMTFTVKKIATDYYDFLDDEDYSPPDMGIPD